MVEDDVNPLDIRAFGMDIERGDTESLKDRFTELFARLPYPPDTPTDTKPTSAH